VVLIGQRFNTAASGNVAYFASVRGRLLGTQGDTLLRVVVPPCTPAGSVAVRVEVGSASTNVVTAYRRRAGTGALALARFEAVTVTGTEQAAACASPAGRGSPTCSCRSSPAWATRSRCGAATP
jgi:hypothetical protein